MSLAAGDSNRMASVPESVPYRHWVRICGVVQHREWDGCLADLAPPRVEPAVAMALISCAFGGRTHCHRGLRALAGRIFRSGALGNAIHALCRRQGAAAPLHAARCPFSLGSSGLELALRSFREASGDLTVITILRSVGTCVRWTGCCTETHPARPRSKTAGIDRSWSRDF